MLTYWLAADRWAKTPVWSPNVGLARTLVMLSGLGTLASSSTSTLLRPAAGLSYPHCSGPAELASWCLVGPEHFELIRWVSCAILLVAAIGIYPRFTAIPAWWVLFSTQAAATTVDGGDQIAANLALLLIPVSLTDGRRWHWTANSALSGPTRTLVAKTALFVIAIQVSYIYLNAVLSKLSVPEWIDGTAVYYWMHDPMFGPSEPLRETIAAMVLNPWLLAAATWGTLVIEFALGISLLLPRALRWPFLVAGVGLHISIATVMGLWSFAFTMVGGLILLLIPGGNVVAQVRRRVRAGLARIPVRRRESIGDRRA